MFEIDLKSRKTICDQIIDNYKELIISGVLSPEEKIPSVRDMAKMLTVNPNTVQKAYRELEQGDYIYVSPGRGTFVGLRQYEPATSEDISRAKVVLREALNKIYYLNFKKGEVKKIFDDVINERSNWDDKSTDAEQKL